MTDDNNDPAKCDENRPQVHWQMGNPPRPGKYLVTKATRPPDPPKSYVTFWHWDGTIWMHPQLMSGDSIIAWAEAPEPFEALKKL